MNNVLHLPVSIGEAIDKLTILDIKCKLITDYRKNDVQREYDLLYEKLKSYIVKYNDLYQTMKKVNLSIWDMMDILRDGNINEELYFKVCKKCVDYNDIRFRIKNKINYISNSLLKEQKSYKTNRLFIEINKEIQNITDFIKPIKYYSFIFDEIIVIVNNEELITEFSYDPSIIFYKDSKDIEEYIYIKKYYFCDISYNTEKIYDIFEINNTILNEIL